MSTPDPVVPDTILLSPSHCACGEFLSPNLVETTMSATEPTWVLTWRCPFEMQHKWKAAADVNA
jgi:hypothetical protein